MNLINSYASDEEESVQRAEIKKPKLELAPFVETKVLFCLLQDYSVAPVIPGETTKEIAVNVPYEDLSRPLQGPANPFSRFASTAKNLPSGYAEEYAMTDHTFNTLERTYQAFGYTLDPENTGEIIGDRQKAAETGGLLVSDLGKKERHLTKNRKRKAQGTADDVEGFQGPWAGFEDDDFVFEGEQGPTEEEIEASERARLEAAAQIKTEGPVERTVFHGKSEKDAQGKTYMDVPEDISVDLSKAIGSQACFFPKTNIHTWSGHTKGVNAIRFIPGSAHLLLSASMDTRIKIWDVYGDRRCLRTYMGHSKAVRDICFSNDGRQFLSASYDKMMKLWDTETGQCISRFTTKKLPYCIKFNPDADKQNIFLTGCADKKVYKFDTRTKQVVMEYDQHLGPVQTISFIDNNSKFVTTSEDKSIRVWDYENAVVVKHITDPSMQAMPAVASSPSKQWLAFQSVDNHIYIFGGNDKFKINKTKVFKGHNISGYACQPGFSPDEKYVMSGDSAGNAIFWEWKNCKIAHKFRAHDNCVVGIEWNPYEASRVATCSWDGTIKYFC